MQATIPLDPEDRGMARKMSEATRRKLSRLAKARPRTKSGQFKKSRGGSSSNPAKKNPPAKRTTTKPAKKKTTTASRSHSNPDGMELFEPAIAGLISAGADILVVNVVAPQWPRAAAWLPPIAKLLGGWWLRTRTRWQDAGSGFVAIGAAELAAGAIAGGMKALAGAAPEEAPADEAAAWLKLAGNFPRGTMAHPMASKDKLSNVLAFRRPGDQPIAYSTATNLASAL